MPKSEAKRAAFKRYRERNIEKFRAWDRKRKLAKYGLTPESFQRMYKLQGGKCWICHVDVVPGCVDHDHATGEVRGVLCGKCNAGLGHFQDSPESLERAAQYLRCKVKLTLEHEGKTASVGLRPDTSEYLKSTHTVDPSDRRIKDLILAAWALAQELKR